MQIMITSLPARCAVRSHHNLHGRNLNLRTNQMTSRSLALFTHHLKWRPCLRMRTDTTVNWCIGILKVFVSFILSYLAWYLQQYLQQVGGCCIFRGDIMAAIFLAQNQLRANRRVRRRLCVDRKHHR